MAAKESAHSSQQCNHVTRRAALQSTAAIGAFALPAGAAAALPGDVDPGLPQLEAGYRRWCALEAKSLSLCEAEDEAFGRIIDESKAKPAGAGAPA
jgi:hypothetical protein